MANKMLIDATHPEETRVVVLRGNRVEEFDFESAQRKQLRGNIYLAKVTRVEPSLQAAFIDYGGNRHGFLAFSEIHPDYYQIPVADRQALIEEEQRAHRAADDEIDRKSRHRGRPRHSASRHRDDVLHGESPEAAAGEIGAELGATGSDETTQHSETDAGGNQWHGLPESSGDVTHSSDQPTEAAPPVPDEPAAHEAYSDTPYTSDADATGAALPEHAMPRADIPASETTVAPEAAPFEGTADHGSEGTGEARDAAEVARTGTGNDDDDGADNGDAEDEEIVESVGGADAMEEVPDRAPRYRRQYKIQEVIKRRQVMLVQVVKEERGTKGAALTTYLSLAGRYSVLMPNTARGGGISRKITNGEDRSRLKEIAQELEVPEGMGVILRTAGASRTKTEIKRDFEYLLRLWETVRDLTLRSTAPKLVYEEGSLVKRSIRDLYSKDIDEVVVAGAEAYEEAKDFMRMLMPSHARNVKLDPDTQPLLSRYGVENQLDAMFSPVVQLRSGGYIVLNQAEALVAIDVNSGRATREHHIEDTALKTNLEAADEVARQLRLRDLAGLVVIDFIDMEEKRNNRAVERRLKECLKQDRARIQVGRISHFGLLEMSRQRIRASVLESSTEKCPYCGGSGHVRSVSSLALQVLRALEEQLMRGATHNLIARTRPDVALYVLNQKRAHLRSLEERFAITITISADESVRAPQAFIIDRGEQVHTPEAARTLAEKAQPVAVPLEEEDDLEEPTIAEGEAAEEQVAEDNGEQREGEQRDGGPRRRRRRGRGGRGGRGGRDDARADGEAPPNDEPAAHEALDEAEGGVFSDAERDIAAGDDAPAGEPQGEAERQDRQDHGEPPGEQDGDRRRRRRGRRGGRRNRHERDRNGDNGHDVQGRDEQQPHGEFAPADLEPEPRGAVADLDASPQDSGTRNSNLRESGPPPLPHEAPFAPTVTVQSAEVAAHAPEPEASPSRRRSTVREPAPVSNSAAGSGPPPIPASSSPAPEPVITEVDEGDSANQPRRTGWWSRRSAGG
jgi:ribonuclease E